MRLRHGPQALRDSGRGRAPLHPPECICVDARVIQGNPDPKRMSISYVERLNLTIRMGMHRFTRLTNAFSNKVENLAVVPALPALQLRAAAQEPRGPLPRTPAMAAGVEDHIWTLQEIAGLLAS